MVRLLPDSMSLIAVRHHAADECDEAVANRRLAPRSSGTYA